MPQPRSFWIDVGGTFTDCIALSPDGSIQRLKLLSTDNAPVTAIRQLMRLTPDQPVGTITVGLGTTRGTNALLQRNGAPVTLITTAGFADALTIGNQTRPHLFKLNIQKPPDLHQHTIEINERIDAHGNIITPLDPHATRKQLTHLKQLAPPDTSLAICLVNAYTNPTHEQQFVAIASELGFAHVSTSTQLSPTIRYLDRADTTVLDAYLSPIIRNYLANLARQMPQAELRVMTSAGGLIHSNAFSGKDSLLSGPAGGVVGFAHAAQQAGFQRAIGFDMGGTSTDVSRFDGRFEQRYSGEIDGVRCVTPSLAIETVAAGGGSVCAFDGQRLTVGPQSAGANPGPACYGNQGLLALTDINLFNGKIDPARFPFPLDTHAVTNKLEALAQQTNLTPHQLADGFTKVANLKMASAIQRVSSARGYDPADHILVAFGGAAAQHACAIAKSLNIKHILIHPLAGVLSAYGIGTADARRFAEQTILLPLTSQTLEQLEPIFTQLEQQLTEELTGELTQELSDQPIPPSRIQPPIRLLDLRYTGQQDAITITQPHDNNWRAAFESQHQQLYGHTLPKRAIEIATLRIELTATSPKPTLPTPQPAEQPAKPIGQTTVYFNAQPHPTPQYERNHLRPNHTIQGPAIIYENLSTIVIDPHFSATVTQHNNLLITDEQHATSAPSADADTPHDTSSDPIRLELFNNHFTHIATQMGLTLQRTSLSVNVRERLDFSCAILDATGNLVVNAPHIPVHLGAMSDTAHALLQHVPIHNIQPGDAYLTNHPDLGGSHLPDLTVITPVFDSNGKHLRFFTASRAHHAEIGGARPGSTFPFAKNLAEEGVAFRNLRITRNGTLDEQTLLSALTTGPLPSRKPEENLADINAALAANTLGKRELESLINQHTWPVVSAYMNHIRSAAAQKARAAIAAIPDGVYTFTDQLDDGSPLKLTLTINHDQLRADFTGTGPVNPNAFNANTSIVRSAILYCIRCLIDQDIPLNGGVMEPVNIILPTCMLNPPHEPDPAKHAAVAAGNVELSQRVVDMFFGALQTVAASQGTMNNLIFGNERFGYYETIGGGSGAGPTFNGANAVHTHMTNTRLTDVELLESQHPVRLTRFAIRRASGGNGKHTGGDGITRTIQFLEPLTVSLLSQRRTVAPFGITGGQPGKPGINSLKRADGTIENLGPLAQFDAGTGDELTIETPGGGGYGPHPNN